MPEKTTYVGITTSSPGCRRRKFLSLFILSIPLKYQRYLWPFPECAAPYLFWSHLDRSSSLRGKAEVGPLPKATCKRRALGSKIMV